MRHSFVTGVAQPLGDTPMTKWRGLEGKLPTKEQYLVAANISALHNRY